MAQVEFKPVTEDKEEIEFKPIEFKPISEAPKEDKGLGLGAAFSKESPIRRFWDWGNTSVFGDKVPAERILSPDVTISDIQREGFEQMTTPFSLAGELAGGVGLVRMLKGKKVPPVPEVLPPEAPKAPRALLLERTRARYIAGPIGESGQVAPLDSANAIIEATLSGSNKPKGAIPSSQFIDLDEIKESERLKKLFFTDVEQQGGRRMDIPDKPLIESPVQYGERKLGFDPGASKAESLPYPLNVVPEAVRPRQAQTVVDALTPNRFKEELPGAKPKVEFESPKIEDELMTPDDSGIYSGTGATRFGEEGNLPSAREIDEAAKNVGINAEKLNEAANLAPPPVAQAVRQVIKEESQKPSVWKSIYTELKGQSEELYRRSFRSVQLENQYKAKWMPDVESALRKLSKDERANFGSYVEGTTPITSPTVREAVQKWKLAEDAIGNEAVSRGLRMFTDEGEAIPFQKNPNYWPHVPVDEIPKKKLVDKLVDSGMSRAEANRVEAHYQKHGEIRVSPQYARTLGAHFPYKLDGDIALNHIRKMSRRIAQHNEFGPLDIEGRGNLGIADLIEGTKDSKKTLALMQRILSRDGVDDAKLMRLLQGARKYAVYTKLQNFAIPNVILGQTTTATKAARYPIESLKEVSQLLSKRYRDEIRASGVWQDFATTLLEEQRSAGRDWLGIGAGERFNRGIAAAVGRAVANSSFKTLKANPADKLARKELFELLGEYPDEILSQPRLTGEQLKMAAGRMAEKTQGLNVPGNLAHWMSKPVTDLPSFVAQASLIFKKMGYQATKTIWEQVKADPARTIPVWLAAAGVGGELVGDVKQGIRGIWTGNPDERIQDRGSFWLENAGITKSSIEAVANASGVPEEVIARLVDNYMQAFFLGLPADMLMSAQFGPEKLISGAMGPVAGDLSRAANRVMELDLKGAAKDAVRSLPVPGSAGLVEKLFD